MKTINSFFKVSFNSREIGEQNLLHFTYDHLQNLIQRNNNSKFDQMINNTSKLYYELLDSIKQNVTIKNTKVEQTEMVDNIIAEIKECIRKLEGLIRCLFSKKSKTYEELFPIGLSEYCRLNRSNIESLMIRVQVFFKKHPDVNSKDISEKIKELHTLYQQSRKEQLKKKSNLKNNYNEKKYFKEELAKNLHKNLYQIALEHLNQPDISNEYFNENLLWSKRLKNKYPNVNINIKVNKNLSGKISE